MRKTYQPRGRRIQAVRRQRASRAEAIFEEVPETKKELVRWFKEEATKPTIGVAAGIRKRQWQRDHPHKIRAHHLKKTYGLTSEEYDAMFLAQGGLCAVCHKPETAANHWGKKVGTHTVKRLTVDHDHTTGKVRGLTCAACNTMLGYGRDDPSRLDAGAQYLRRDKPEFVAH